MLKILLLKNISKSVLKYGSTMTKQRGKNISVNKFWC